MAATTASAAAVLIKRGIPERVGLYAFNQSVTEDREANSRPSAAGAAFYGWLVP
jgi:hypothetical protein